MNLNNRQMTRVLWITECVGIVFVALFAIAYLGGLATSNITNVLHSELILRIPLGIFGAILLILSLIGAFVAIYVKQK